MAEASAATQPDEITFFGCAGDFQELAAPILERVADVLGTGHVLQGPDVVEFERRIATLAGKRHAVAVGSGTDALFFALKALGIGSGDEVLVPNLSFIASASAVVRTGATPIFVDIDASCNLDLDRAGAQVTPRTRSLLYVHLFGGMGDPSRLADFATKYGLAVVEDCAQSLGATFNGHPCGATGQISVFSFDPTKVIGAPGSGGAIATDDTALRDKVRRLRYHGKAQDAFVELGYNSQMPSLTAAILQLKLNRHDEWTARRRAIAERYKAAFFNLPLHMPNWQVGHVWHKFVVNTRERDPLMAHLRNAGIPTMVHYATPFHREAMFAGSHGQDAEYPTSCRHAEMALSLPIHSHMTDDQVDRVTEATKGYYRNHRPPDSD